MNIRETRKSNSMFAVVVAITAVVLAGCDSAGAGDGGGGGGGGLGGSVGITATADGTSEITWEVSGSINGDPIGPDYSIAWTYTEPSGTTFSDSVTDVTGGALDWSETANGLEDGTGLGLSYTALETHDASVTLTIKDDGAVVATKTIDTTLSPPNP
jgi:hypothetical protein